MISESLYWLLLFLSDTMQNLLNVQEYFDYRVNGAHECKQTLQSSFYLFIYL